jgi:hypothetical protein
MKIIIAKQASIMYQFLNTKRKLLITNGNIWFNKQAIALKLIPNYVNIKVAGTNLQAKRTKRVAELIRIKNELKFLYKKK